MPAAPTAAAESTSRCPATVGSSAGARRSRLCTSFGRFLAQSGNTSSGTVGGDERIRLFIGLRLPEDTLARLEGWQRATFGEVRDLRVVDRGNLHVTLAFLGHRPASELGPIA
jgi:hypothetical protein